MSINTVLIGIMHVSVSEVKQDFIIETNEGNVGFNLRLKFGICCIPSDEKKLRQIKGYLRHGSMCYTSNWNISLT